MKADVEGELWAMMLDPKRTFDAAAARLGVCSKARFAARLTEIDVRQQTRRDVSELLFENELVTAIRGVGAIRAAP